jgi:phosphatidylglycerophosphate synthase
MPYIKIKNHSALERLFRGVSYRIVVNYLAKTKITPNQVTFFRFFVIWAAFICFAFFNVITFTVGFLCIFLWDLLDCVDGDLATHKNMKSKFGEFMEEVFDFSVGRLSGPLSFAVMLAYLKIFPEHLLVGLMALVLIIFSDRFFGLTIERKNKIFSLTGESLVLNDSMPRHYKLGKTLYDVFLYYELQVSALVFLIISVFNAPHLIPFWLILIGTCYLLLGIGVFNFVRKSNV